MNNGIARRKTAEPSALSEIDTNTTARVVESMVLRGDISALSPEERAKFYLQMCESLGLSAASQPLAVLKLNGKEVLYPTRGATDQLAAIHRLNRRIVDGPKVVDIAGTKMVYAVCEATHPNGRVETATATVPLVDPVNVLMKAETKAKRRATLSILGLGMLDETEIETIPDAAKGEARPIRVDVKTDSSRAKPSDEEKAARVAAILRDYDAAIESGTAPDVAHEDAKRAGRDAGVATLVQAELTRRASAEAEAKRTANLAYEAHAAEVIDTLNAALDSAGDVPAAIAGAWVDHSEAVLNLRQEDAQKAKLQVENAWKAAGGARGGLSAAAKAERERRAQSAGEVQS